jgi:transcription-repair coupling factor (superfamily II helicase)
VSTVHLSAADQVIDVDALLKRYEADAQVQLLLAASQAGKPAQVKGLVGSLDAIVAAALYRLRPQTYAFILHDKEEAAYFQNDLQTLLPFQEIHFFPTSYKKPYQLTEVENANVLQRSEVLNRISQKAPQGHLVVTYPEALTEKVINQRSLLEHTMTVSKGERLDVAFTMELLAEYGFERTDFVYEAGQFAVRGGIVDIFSYANELPYRIDLFSDEVESIRVFDPITQMSVEDRDSIAIIPNVQTKLRHEVRESFFRFLPQQSTIWIKDWDLTADTIGKYFQLAQENFDGIMAKSGHTQVSLGPADLFETREGFGELLSGRHWIEFGKKFGKRTAQAVQFHAQPQASFNKDFNLLADELEANDMQGYTSVVVAEYQRQLARMHSIFDEMRPGIRFLDLNASLHGGFTDREQRLALYTDHQFFERYHKYRSKRKFTKSQALTLKELRELQVGDYVVHVDHGIGRFSGLAKVKEGTREQEAVRLVYKDNDMLFVSIHSLHKISKYTGQEGVPPKISKLGSPEWENKKSKVKKKVKDIAAELIKLYAKRKLAKGFSCKPDDYMQVELESSFLYEDTPDQAKATDAVKADMEASNPMDRLVCGDVGFGKTEVAIRAAFKAVANGKQVAVLVPTTILAMQHHRTFRERIGNLPCNIEYINRFRSTNEIKDILKKLASGEVDILIGTHRITSKDVKFKDLGLLVVDEEQKFGVKTKDRIKEMRVHVDVLTLTATPIPRTLHFSLLGARDLSVIATPPPNRQPVTTELHTYGSELIRDAVRMELQRGGQVFFVHNRVSDIEAVANQVLELVPDARVAYAHGQMDGKILEKIMMKFMEGEYDVLVSTNIIEAGLDIPNANTIIINRAHMFGLSDLHQMRGRVGRSNRKAYCYLLTPPTIGLSADARRRLSALEEFSDLGDGFKVAMRDLDIRGAGNLLGAEQSGFISDLGFETYTRILEEAVQELKEQEFREIFHKELSMAAFKTECHIESDFEIVIPETYVANISERLNLYIQADDLKDEEELRKFRAGLADRFGKNMPPQVEDLLNMVRMRWLGERLGMEKLLLKNGMLKAHLPENTQEKYYQSPIFEQLLRFLAKQATRKFRMKQTDTRMIVTVEGIDTVEQAMKVLEDMLRF